MKVSIALAAALGLTMAVNGRIVPRGAESPKEVLQDFLKLELVGARLLTGQSTTSQFFVSPQPSFSPNLIFIVSDDFDLTELPSEKETAKISVFFHDYYGTLDKKMRFAPAPTTGPRGGIVKKGITSDYTLVPTKRLTQNNPADKESADRSEWKIVKPQAGPTVDMRAAKEYLKELRDRTTDPTIKNNANNSLDRLSKLDGSPRR